MHHCKAADARISHDELVKLADHVVNLSDLKYAGELTKQLKALELPLCWIFPVLLAAGRLEGIRLERKRRNRR